MKINDSGDLTCKQQLDELIAVLKPHGYGKLIHCGPSRYDAIADTWWALTLPSGEKVIYVGTQDTFDYWRAGVEAVYEAIVKRPERIQ